MFTWIAGNSCNSCSSADPTTDTVRFEPSTAMSEEQDLGKRNSEAEEAAQREREHESAAELERQRVAEAERRRQEELEAQRHREQEAAEELARLQRQREKELDERRASEAEAERQRVREEEEKAREVERQRVERARLRKQEADDKLQMDTWLTKHNYAGVNAKKTKMFKTTYPLHEAVKEGDANMVRFLLRFKADASQKAAGQNAHEFAQKMSQKGSSSEMLAILSSDVNSQARRLAGA